MVAKDREMRVVFNAFDADHDGVIRFEDISTIMTALNLHPSASDYKLLAALRARAEANGQAGIRFYDFREILSMVNPTEFSRIAEDSMAAWSLGFQSKSKAAAKGIAAAAAAAGGAAGAGGVGAAAVGAASSAWFAVMANTFSGALANVFSRTTVAPLERVRLQMSVDSTKCVFRSRPHPHAFSVALALLCLPFSPKYSLHAYLPRSLFPRLR